MAETRGYPDDTRACSFDEAGRAIVEDLGSTNGTWINEQRLTEARICASGDVLRVGQTTFEVELPAARGADPSRYGS